MKITIDTAGTPADVIASVDRQLGVRSDGQDAKRHGGEHDARLAISEYVKDAVKATKSDAYVSVVGAVSISVSSEWNHPDHRAVVAGKIAPHLAKAPGTKPDLV